MTTYKLNNTTNSLLKIGLEKPNKMLDKTCLTCDKVCSMFCDNRCGSWLCPNKHYLYFDKEGNKHSGHSPMCGFESDEEYQEYLNEERIKKLKSEGHTIYTL